MRRTEPHGFLNINKPLQLTSHDVVARVRRRYRSLTSEKKVGHAGALDPLASGVLVLCLGKATRLSEVIMRRPKVYRAEITFGASTTTYDAAGEFLSSPSDANNLKLEAIRKALPDFTGDIKQIPPMYSAIKRGGQKLYDIARRGETVEREARSVHIQHINILGWERPTLELEVKCGPGVYIRSLAHDLGEALGVGGYLSGLQRAKSGSFCIEDSLGLACVLADDRWLSRIVAPWDALEDEAKLIVSDDEVADLSHGRAISRGDAFDGNKVFAFDRERRLIAELEVLEDLWQPRKVFGTGV